MSVREETPNRSEGTPFRLRHPSLESAWLPNQRTDRDRESRN